MIEVEIPDVGIVEFPDELSEDDVSNEVRRLTQRQPEPNPIPALDLERLAKDQQFQENLRAYTGGSPVSPFGPEMDFARSLYVDVPQKIGEGVETVMKPIGKVAAPVFSQLRQAVGVANPMTPGVIPPELRQGESYIEGLEPNPEARGVIPSLRRAASGLTTPESLAILPFTAGSGAFAKGLQGAFALTAGAAVPGALQELSTAETPAERRGAITDAALNTLFAVVIGREASRPNTRAETISMLRKALESEPQLPIRTAQVAPALRQLGIPQEALTAEPFLQPGVRELASEALRDAQGPRIEVPGELSALETLRREIEPPQVDVGAPTRRAERVEGGGEAPYGKVTYRRPAEEIAIGKSVAASLLDPIATVESKPIGEWQGPPRPAQPLKSVVDRIREQLERRDLVAAVDLLSKQPADVQAKTINEALGVGSKKIPLSAAERTIFNEIWEKVYNESLGRPASGILPVQQMRPIPPGLGEEITAPSVETVRAQRELESRAKPRNQKTAREFSEEEWESISEDLADAADMFSEEGAARHGGQRPYELYDLIDEFLDFAKTRPDETISSALDRFKGEVSKSKFRKLRLILEDQQLVEAVKKKGGDKNAIHPESETVPRDVQQQQVPQEGAEQVPKPEGGQKAAETLTPPPGERLVELVNPDGTTETVSFSDKFYDWPGKGRVPSIARWNGQQWTHGAAEAGQTIREITPASTSESGVIAKLESLKLPETGEGRLYSLPHPDAIKAIGRTTWNNAIDLAIAAVKAGKSLAEAVEAALAHIRRNATGKFDEGQARANLDYIMANERPTPTPPAPPVPPSGTPPTPPTPTPPPGRVSLDDVYNRFVPEAKSGKSIVSRIAGAVGQGVEALRTGFSSRFRPLDKLAEDIAKAYPETVAKAKRVAHIFEQLKGSSGKAEADVYRFNRDVSNLVEGLEKDFNAYMFLRRSLDRLLQDQAEGTGRRKVSGYTIPELEAKLAQLETNLGPEKTKTLRDAGELYQQHLNAALQLQVESGRMSPELYKAIKDSNEFYAPFKILKYLDESSRPEGSGRKVDTVADFTKAMVGIEDPKFKLGDMLAAARQSITMSRILAEKNSAMRKFAEMADQDTAGIFVRKLGKAETAPKGMETVNVMQNGVVEKYAVDPAVAEAVTFYNTPTSELISSFLRGVSIPFRAGATTANVAFQPVNLLLADAPRAALVSRYGVRGAADIVRYPVEMVQSMLASMQANLLKRESKLYLDYLDSGAAGSVIQDYLSPELLKRKEPTAGSRIGRIAKSIISKPAEFAKAIEETNKVLGIKRAMRIEGVTSGKELAKKVPEAITEVRRFSGSPDFGRVGSWTEAARLNLIYMFLNARIQGAVSDVGRLTGRDGAKTAAATWGKMMTAVGVPAAALYYYNNLPQNKEDYEKRPKWERDNYFLIPRDRYIEDENGEKVRDYWRIPKREMVQITANMVESGLKFAQDNDPEAFSSLAFDTLENLSPVNMRGRSFQERMESSLASLNPVFKAPIEMGTGRDLFRHRDIVPDVMKKASPEQQYTDRTPEVFKMLANLMPDASFEVLRSPLMLEAATRDFTANLITQFIPQKPVKGREGIANAPLLQPLMRRFQGSPMVDTEADRLAIEELQRQAADAFLAKDRSAREVIKTAQDPSEIAQSIFKSQGVNEQSVATVDRAIDLWMANKNGVTREERQVLNLPVEQRADYILKRMEGLNQSQRSELIGEYVRKRIATQAVMEKMAEKSQPK